MSLESQLNTSLELAQPLNAYAIITNTKLMKSRKISEGRMVEFNSLAEFRVFEQFYSTGWSFLIDQHEVIYPRHLKEFYAGYNFNESTSIITISMYNKTWCWTLENFCDLLHIPCDGPKIFIKSHDLSDLPNVEGSQIVKTICKNFVPPQTTMLTQEDLLPECIVWHKIIVHNLTVRGDDLSKVLALEAYVLYCLKSLKPCNLGFILLKNMTKLPLMLHTPLKYGMLLSRLFEKIDLPTTSFLLPIEPILTKNQLLKELDKASKFLKSSFPTPCLPHELVFKTNNSSKEKEMVTRSEFENLQAQVEESKKSITKLFNKMKKGLANHGSSSSTRHSYC